MSSDLFSTSSLSGLFAGAFTQTNRLMKLHWDAGSGIPEDLLLPHRLKGREALSECYYYELECLSSDGLIELKRLMGHSVAISVAISIDGGMDSLAAVKAGERLICGVVTGVKKLASEGGFTKYWLRIEPCLALLKKTRIARVWEQFTIPDMVNEILQEKSRNNVLFSAAFKWEMRLSRSYQKRAYRVMFGETEYAFIDRSLREEGISFTWRFEGGSQPSHTLVLFDAPGVQLDACKQSNIDFRGPHDLAGEAGIQAWEGHREFYPGLTSLCSYDPEVAHTNTCAEPTHLKQATDEQSLAKGLEDFSPQIHRFAADKDALALHARFRQEWKDMQSKLFHGRSNVCLLQAGNYFRFLNHPDHARDSVQDQEFIVLSLEMEAVNNFDVSLKTALSGLLGQESQGEPSYGNSFTCVRRQTPIRPELDPDKHSRPSIHGLQSAFVVGPEGEETYTDEQGRVRIRFPWQRSQEHKIANPDHYACWARVAYGGAAGHGWGVLNIPRIGQEVLVAFLEGDPDKPVVVGALHNGKNAPARFSGQSALPINRQLSGLRSREYQGSRGSELLFDDTQGQLRARLATDYASSELNLGFLTHPKGKAKVRGEGAELRSDESVAIRGAKGVLLSAAAQLKADGPQLERSELLELVQASKTLLESLADYAEKHQGLQAEAEGLKPEAKGLKAEPKSLKAERGIQSLEENLKNWERGTNTRPKTEHPPKGQQMIAMSAPDGIFAATPECLNLYAGETLDLTAQKHSHYTVGQALLVNAGKGISLFAHAGGCQAIAHQGDVQIQAQSGDIVLTANKNIKMIASENEVLICAKKKITLIAGDSYITLGEGNIELGCKGTLKGKAAKKEWLGAASMGAEMPKVDVGKTERRFKKIRKDSGEPISGMKYTLRLADGSTRQGVTDSNGFTEIIESDNLQRVNIQFEDLD